VVAFCFQEISYSAPLPEVVGTPPKPIQVLSQDPKTFEAPLDFCTLKEIHHGPNGQFIIHIQDAHSNFSGQESLASAIDEMMSKYGISLILTEGASKEATLDPIKKMAPSKEICKRVARSFLLQGKIAGEEYLNLVSDHPMKIMGIEDRALYLESIENYGALSDKREDILRYLVLIGRALNKLKAKLYPPELLIYEKQDQKEGFESNFKELIAIAQNSRVDLTDLPNVQKLLALQAKEKQMDFNAANIEQAALVEEISQKGAREDFLSQLQKVNRAKNQKVSQFSFFQNTFRIASEKGVSLQKYPNLVRYGDYLKEFSDLDLEGVLDELTKAEERVYASLLSDKNARLVRSIDRYVKLLNTAYNIRMSTKDFKFFEANEPDFATAAYLAFINRRLIEYGFFDDLVPYKSLLDEGKKSLVAFYESVDQRDMAFIHNTERILNDAKQNIAVLIAGGYHTSHLTKLLKQNGYSYAVLTPAVTSETDQAKYEKLLLSPVRKKVAKVESIHGESRRRDRSLDEFEKGPVRIKKTDNVKAFELVMHPENPDLGVPAFAEALGVPLGGEGARLAIQAFAQRADNPPYVENVSVSSESGARMAFGSKRSSWMSGIAASRILTEGFDEIVLKELAKARGVSVDDLEADFERNVRMMEERIQNSGYVALQDDEIAQKIYSIFDRLIAVYQTQTTEAPGVFHIVDANTVNAFVIRKRSDVYFFKGLYETLYDISLRMKVPLTEDMIAFIIAHELSHALQHSSHQGLDVRDLNESVSPFLIQMIKNGEYDADMRALELMDKAGYSVFGAIDAMTFLEFITSSSQAENVLSSHPYVSLRKHKLSQIIFDQKTNVFTNVKAPRTPMVGRGRIKSRDVDFRHLMDKTEQELLAMAQNAESITELDELAGMLTVRKRMNALRALVNEEYLKTSFLRHVYVQAVLAAVITRVGVDVMPDNVDYGDMRGAAAIHDFGIPATANGISQEPNDKFKEPTKDVLKEIRESLSYHTVEDVVAARNLLETLISTVRRRANSLDHRDFDGFLLPRDEVQDLIPIFTKAGTVDLHGVSAREKTAARPTDSQISSAIQDPRRLISAFFYANYLGQEPSVEFGIPTTEMRVKLQRRKNEVYLENPAYRDVQSLDARRALQEIILLHYAMKRTDSGVFDDHLNVSFPGIDEFLKVSPNVATTLFSRYYESFSKMHPKPIALQLAAIRMRKYFGIDHFDEGGNKLLKESGPEGFADDVSEARKKAEAEYKGEPVGRDAYVSAEVGRFISGHPLIVFIEAAIHNFDGRLARKTVEKYREALKNFESKRRYYEESEDKQAILAILRVLARIYSQEPQREVEASSVFSSETKLDYYLKKEKIESLKSLMALPDWAVSDYLKRKKYDQADADKLIQSALKDGMPLEEVFAFMRTQLAYADRKKVFADLFLEYSAKPIYLFNYFKAAFNNDPHEIVVWFLGMFSKNDALELMDKLSRETLYKKARETQDATEAAEFKKLTIAILEYVYGQTSKTFHPNEKTVKIYLDLISDQAKESGARMAVQDVVFNALMVLSASANLQIKLSHPEEMTRQGSPDFKTKETNILPPKFDGSFTRFKSNLSLHNFGWNDDEPTEQSIFITHLTDLSIGQLKQLLKQRLQYLQSRVDIEYRGEIFSLSGLDDFFSNLVTLIMLKKIANPNWASKSRIERLEDLIEVTAYFHTDKEDKKKIKLYSPDIKLKIDQREINAIPYQVIKDNFIGVAIPSGTLDPVWEAYVKANNLYDNFPEIVPLLQNPNVGNECIYNPIAFLEKHNYTQKVPYRQVAKKFFMDSSVYAKLFNAYVKSRGKGYVYGKFKPLEERLAWMESAMPNKSIIKDSILDFWETDIFPEIIADLPALMKLARQAAQEGEELRDMWALLGEMDDDVSRLKRLSDQITLSPERIQQLLDFYDAIIPLTLSPQKIARYGATCYMLWKQLPGNAELGLPEHLAALTQFMPEPSVLRDELLMQIGNKYARHMADAPQVCARLYSNNLLSRNRDLRTEDFVSETLLHVFGAAKIEDRRDILLWLVGATEKPQFVVDVENKYNIDFTTLPADVKLLPSSIREKFIEGFMLGDNGVLDPQSASDRVVMSDFLNRLFLFIFPEGTKGIDNENRILISRIFLTVMTSFPPYRRVQVIKALAALCVRADFERTSPGERFSVLLGVMGPVGIKVAQYLSENDTLVPDESMRSSLGALRHRAPEITKISVCSTLENEVPLSEVVVREIGEPVGVASIKQVNRGRWLDVDLLTEQLAQKASRADAGEIREKSRLYHAKQITFAEFVSYLVEKSKQYKVDLEKATVSVVYKIRRPNIATTLGIDFAALDAVAHELEGTIHKGEPLNIADLVQTVKEWVTLEKQFGNEVKSHQMLTELDYSWAADLARNTGVAIAHPRVLYATDSLIVEEEIQGVPVLSLSQKPQPITMDDVVDAGYSRSEAEDVFNQLNTVEPRQAHIFLSLKKAGFAEASLDGVTTRMLAYDYEKLRDLLRNMLLHQIFIDGVFHADLHQGNVLVTPDGRLVMIDRGNVGTLNSEQITGAKVLLKGLLLRDKALIKEGIDQIFLHAVYPEGTEPVRSNITLEEIQEVLDKEFDLKMTMNMISVRAVQGSKNTPGGKDFSTFLKAFTQAMYLFPTDLSSGMVTLQAIAKYISMTEEEARRAAEEQAKYVVIKEPTVSETRAGQVDFTQTVKRRFYEKTNRYFLHSIWQPIVFRILMIPVKKALPKIAAMRSNILGLARVYGRQFIEEHIDQFAEKQDLELADAVKDIISAPYAERFLRDYVKQNLKKRFLGRLSAPVVVPLLNGALSMMRPFISALVEAGQEWIGTTGKQYIAGIAPQMTVKEAIGLLSQVFVEDFASIKIKFDERTSRIRSQSAHGVRMAEGARMAVAQVPADVHKHLQSKKGNITVRSQVVSAAPAKDANREGDVEVRLRDVYGELNHDGLKEINQLVQDDFRILGMAVASRSLKNAEEYALDFERGYALVSLYRQTLSFAMAGSRLAEGNIKLTEEQVKQGNEDVAQLRGRSLETALSAATKELRTEPQYLIMDAYREQDRRSAQAFRQMVNRLTENKSAVFRFRISEEDKPIVENIAKEMTEFKAELDRLNQDAAEDNHSVFKARFELTDKDGNVIQTLETAQAMTPAEAAGAAQFHSSIANQAFLDQAVAVNAGYLPTEGIRAGEEVRIFNYKAIGRTGLSVVTDSPSAPQMIEALTGADMSRTDIVKANLQLVKTPHAIPDVSIQTYHKQNLLVRHLATIKQILYRAFVALRATGASA